MKLQRFFGDFDFQNKKIKSTNKGLINQIKNVFRMRAGNAVLLCDGKKNEAKAEICSIDKKEIVFEIKDISQNINEPKKNITLYLSIIKRENFELSVQKAVEVGVSKIVPIISERTVKTGLKIERLKKIIQEAAEQSGRGIIPEITEPIKFRDSLENAKKNEQNIFFHLDGENLNNLEKSGKNTGIFIGPEGGWSNNEVELIKKQKNSQIVSLGSLTLRAETAAIVSLFVILNK